MEEIEDSLADLAISGSPLADANLGLGSPGDEMPPEPPMASTEDRPRMESQPSTRSDLHPRPLRRQHAFVAESHPENRPAILPILVSNGQMSTHDVPSPNDVRCGRCGSTVEKSRARMKAKHCQSWICNVCNCKCVQLARSHGKWPTDEFKGLSKEDQEKFYSDIAKDKSGTELHKVSVEFLEKYNRLP